ncbi:MAG: pyrroline-5-carboxylate reductase [Planctomycetes bacterium]|nr:pyrroline-5-carboxylate reductase [Planctomycetota bacterium]
MTHKLGVIGGGNMGMAIARGGITAHVIQPHDLIVAELDPAKRGELAKLGGTVTDDPREAASAEQFIIAVKPQSFAGVAETIGPLERPTVVISIMAGLSTQHIRERLGENARMIRAMPNTPCMLGEGMTGIALGEGAQPGDEQLAWHIFEAIGRTSMLDESLMHAVTAVSGSGPAYVYFLAELMEKAAVEIGLDEATAQLLVIQTIIGAGRMLRETGADPRELRRVVTTPNGTTAAAVDVMARRQLADIWIEALTAARNRGIELDKEAG